MTNPSPRKATASSTELRKPLQIRIAPKMHDRISFFADATGTSMNRLVIEAVDSYLEQLAAEAESELTNTLRRVRDYATSQDHLERDFHAFVEAEAVLPDPAEGAVVRKDADETISAEIGRILDGLG